jgi:hypothetical protein
LYSGSRSWMTPAAIYVVDITVHCNKVPTWARLQYLRCSNLQSEKGRNN